MKTKLLITGKSCSGKTTLSFRFKQMGKRVGVFHTTRPQRHNEINGVHYNFITDEEYNDIISRNDFVVAESFNNWHYVLTKDEYLNSDVIVLTPSSIKQLFDTIGKSLATSPLRDNTTAVLYLDVTDDVIRDRMMHRMDKAEAERRYLADKEDFREFIAYKKWDIAIDYNIADNFATIFNIFSPE